MANKKKKRKYPVYKKSKAKGFKTLHTELYTKFYGEIPSGYEVHHINSKPKDNSKKNLIAIPKGLHKKIHTAQYRLSKYNKKTGKMKLFKYKRSEIVRMLKKY